MRPIAVVCLGIATILAGLGASAPGSVALPSATSIGGVESGLGFLSQFYIRQCGVSTSFTVTLLRDGVTISWFNQACSGSFLGSISSGADMLAHGDRGVWTLRLRESFSGAVFHEHQWTMPSLRLNATAYPGRANTGDSIWVSTVFSLPQQGGADFYAATGHLVVKAGPDTVSIAVQTPAVETFFGSPVVSDHPYVTGRSVSFGAAGAKAVDVAWSDGFEEVSTSAGVTVVSPLESTLNSIDQRLARLEAKGATKQELAEIRGELNALGSTVAANDTTAKDAVARLGERLETLDRKLDAQLSSERAMADAMVRSQMTGYGGIILGTVALVLALLVRRRRQPIASPLVQRQAFQVQGTQEGVIPSGSSVQPRTVPQPGGAAISPPASPYEAREVKPSAPLSTQGAASTQGRGLQAPRSTCFKCKASLAPGWAFCRICGARVA